MARLASSSRAIREFLYNKSLTVCDNVFDTTRPSAKERMDKFLVVSLKNKTPHSTISDKAWLQFHLYVRDGSGGSFRDGVMQDFIESVKSLDLRSDLYLLNGGEPYETDPKSDGIGFHAVSIQYSVTLIRNIV